MFTYVGNQNHGESVYNLIERCELQPMKPPMYESIYSNMVRNERCCASKGCYRTLGLPQIPLCPPTAFLKKHSRTQMSPHPSTLKSTTNSSQKESCGEGTTTPCTRTLRPCFSSLKPPVPPPCSSLRILERGQKDFVRENALHVIRLPPKVPRGVYVDTPQGTKWDWSGRGLKREMVCKEDYGRVPDYLVQRKIQLHEEDMRAKTEAAASDAAAESKCRHLDEIERQSLVNGLKIKWGETFSAYQSLPLLIDTPKLVEKKRDLEEKLKDTEKDIQLLERHNHIFIADTQKSFYLE